ncbi:TonB-dependent receptor [Pseudoduganella sp. DS3]|uniref:TonB-dependent receptor n=1 Tax=Pseudoduganella guangdongensis TaxID=2692179 RepID=A0A6N9HMC7_9BURK|nr:TonB-dependent receptor [Pseudoduganella guangdongensis]MYN03845.1 TonB-dependent receptor [Pseudoduganella guangdongensis]
MLNHRARLRPSLLAAAVASALCAPVFAQSDTDNELPEVLVTAQRIATPESRTPVAMSVLDGEQLAKLGIDNAAGIGKRLPNVHLDGAADGLRITIRGVSNSDATEKGDPSAAFMQDGIYIARPQAQTLSFLDVDRIEVLRGPQGTLYGRNTTAGVVNVISNAPLARLEGAASLALGSYNARIASGMLNVPATDWLALRAAVALHKHDSYLRNGQGTGFELGQDRDDRAARLSAKVALAPAASLLLRYEHATLDGNIDNIVPDTNFFSGVASGKPVWRDASTAQYLTNSFKPFNTRLEQGYNHKTLRNAGAELAWELGPATLHYLASHRKADHDFRANFYYRALPTLAIGVHEDFQGSQRQDSHELRLSSTGSGALKAQGGLYYFREESHQLYGFRGLQALKQPPYYVFPHGPTIARSRAAFGQLTYSLTPALRATAGARYTSDGKSRVGSTNFQQGPVFNPATDLQVLNNASVQGHKSTWKLGAEVDLAPAAMAYASLATGYKSGGFNDGCLAGSSALGLPCPAAVAVPAGALFYQPETLKSWEAGLKARFWDKRASLNLAVFHYDYTNMQLSGVAIVAGAPRFMTQNAGAASVKGLELDGQVRAGSADRFSYGLTLLDAHYVSYRPNGVLSWAGQPLDRAPRSVLNLGWEHTFRLPGAALLAGVNARRSAAYNISVSNQLLQYRIPARTASDFTLGYRPDGGAWSLLARVKNMENKVQPITIDSFGMAVPSEPRTVDIRLDYRF